MISAELHPDTALYDNEPTPPIIPACEHIAGSLKFIEKALCLRETLNFPFDLTCDLEDGSPIGNEVEHLRSVAELIRDSDPQEFQKKGRIGFRIHDLSSNFWRQDLQTVLELAGPYVSYITLPKIHSRSEIDCAAQELTLLRTRLSLSHNILLHVLIETHPALRNVWEIASHPLVETLDFGIMDFISAHRGAIRSEVMKSPGQFEHSLLNRAKSEIVAAALANSAVPSHNVTIEFKNSEQVFRDARQANDQFGFLRMWSIHPSQIEPIHKAFAPSIAEVTLAEKVLLKGLENSWAPINLDGTLYDRASYRYFWEILKKAHLEQGELNPEILGIFFN